MQKSDIGTMSTLSLRDDTPLENALQRTVKPLLNKDYSR